MDTDFATLQEDDSYLGPESEADITTSYQAKRSTRVASNTSRHFHRQMEAEYKVAIGSYCYNSIRATTESG